MLHSATAANVQIILTTDPTCILLPPKSKSSPTTSQLSGICAAFATRGNVNVNQVRRLVENSAIVEWGKLRHVDSEEGDTIRSATMSHARHDSREASFVRVHLSFILICLKYR